MMPRRSCGRTLAACAAALLVASALPAGDRPRRGALPTWTSSGGVAMIRIPAGQFRMGSAAGQADEKPVHTVRLDAFWMDRHPVTQAQYQRLMGVNPSRRKGRANNPVEQVTWANAARYCNARSHEEGLDPCYDLSTWRCDLSAGGYRLPTEAEWEYACRAGTRSTWFFGDKPDRLQIYAWYKANSGKRPRPVARKSPNPWGLCDMVGNVWQWCNDTYRVDYYKTSPSRNPPGAARGDFKVVRGGSWDSPPSRCRSSARFKENPAFVRACFGRDEYGFRCVRNATARSTSQPATAPASEPSRRRDPTPLPVCP